MEQHSGQKRILITGAGGFVGRAVVAGLLAQGAAVVALDSQPDGIPSGAVAIAGDLGDSGVRAAALSEPLDGLIHLATVPGGAAEADPASSRRINLDAMYDLLLECSTGNPGLRVVFASSIAVLGDPLPPVVDDATPLRPKLIYGGHKAMMEQAVAMLSHRGEIDGVSLRLPAILARPQAPSGMKSAFMSDLFHALKAGRAYQCPVSADGTIWVQSLTRCADNLIHALSLDSALLPVSRAVTLPAQVIAMGALAAEIARQCGTSPDAVEYAADRELQAAFAAQPPLLTPGAESAGFAHDGDLATLVASALATLQ